MKLCTSNHAGIRSQTGIMLIECMIYIAVWAVLVGIAFSTFYRALEYHRTLSRAADDIAAALWAGEDWREDIRRATNAPQPAIINAPNGTRQTLRIQQTNGVVTYTLLGTDLFRQTQTASRAHKVLSNVRASRMTADALNPAVWRWELELKTRRERARIKPLFSFAAVSSPTKP